MLYDTFLQLAYAKQRAPCPSISRYCTTYEEWATTPHFPSSSLLQLPSAWNRSKVVLGSLELTELSSRLDPWIMTLFGPRDASNRCTNMRVVPVALA
ncbi:hypothetical protein ABKN59_004063 [Abortiporus biennis]